ncbi:hypothetical protein AAF712_016545, partial [Marasmius tenuissimus]
LVYSMLRLQLVLKPGLNEFFKEYKCGKDVGFAVEYFQSAKFTEKSEWTFMVSKFLTSFTCIGLIIRNLSLRLTKIVEWPPIALCSFMYLISSTIDLLRLRAYDSEILKICTLIAGCLAVYWSLFFGAGPEPLIPTEEKPRNDPQALQAITSAPVKPDFPEEPNVSETQDHGKQD